MDTNSDQLIGTVGLYGIQWPHRNAMTGTIIGEKEFWSRGYATEAKMLLLDFAFNTLDLFCVISKAILDKEQKLSHLRDEFQITNKVFG